MNKRRIQSSVLLSILLLLIAAGTFIFWVRAQQRQFALNRRLIAALVQGLDQDALELVKEGADPNTRYDPSPAPSLKQLWSQLLHRAPPPDNESPTAFLIACGALWNDEPDTYSRQGSHSDDARLIQVMLAHGANVNERDERGDTALMLAVSYNRDGMVDCLLKSGANVNAQGAKGETALCDALYRDYDTNIAEHLLAHGANPNIATDSGENALSIARKEEHSDFIHLLLQHGAKAPPHRTTSVPAIARLLGVRVGYNGQDALTRQFGDGLHTTGGHPGGRKLWYTRLPSGLIETDGFDYNDEGLVLESLYWSLDTATDPTIPFVRHLPHHAGWLGVIIPGMTMAQVAQLTSGLLPAPQREGNVWKWTAKGFVRPSRINDGVYTTWTATLTFQNGALDSIDVRIE
jgi:hypothetical protein